MIRQKQVDKASTVTYYLLLIISYYDCHDKYINIAWGPFWLNEEIRYDEIQYEMLKLHAFSPNFQPAHSPELCGRREDKLAASALGGNAKKKICVSILCFGSRCQQLQLPGDLTWKQKVPAPHRVGKKGSPHWLREVGKLCQAQFSGTKPHDANPGFLDWLRKTFWLV